MSEERPKPLRATTYGRLDLRCFFCQRVTVVPYVEGKAKRYPDQCHWCGEGGIWWELPEQETGPGGDA